MPVEAPVKEEEKKTPKKVDDKGKKPDDNNEQNGGSLVREIGDINIDRSLSGYDIEDEYFVMRFTQGGRRVYNFSLPLDVAAVTFPKPDPENKTPGNRRISKTHGEEFGTYVRENANWVAPSLLGRAPSSAFKFELLKSVRGVQFGILRVPRNRREALRILDGQHRVYGAIDSIEKIEREREDVTRLMHAAERNGSKEEIKHYQEFLDILDTQRRRIHNEHVAIQVIETDDQHDYEQIFVDIADNALGIKPSLRVMFDTRKVANRAVERVVDHPLLKDRVEVESSTVRGDSPNWLAAQHVVDIIRTVKVGITGKIGKVQEKEFNEDELVELSTHFLNTLMLGFEPLAQLAKGEVTAKELRDTSLLGSVTMIKALAGLYYDLNNEGWSDEDISELFRDSVAPLMDAPVKKSSKWHKIAPGAFDAESDNVMAPLGRRQNTDRLMAGLHTLAKGVTPVKKEQASDNGTATQKRGRKKAA